MEEPEVGTTGYCAHIPHAGFAPATMGATPMAVFLSVTADGPVMRAVRAALGLNALLPGG